MPKAYIGKIEKPCLSKNDNLICQEIEDKLKQVFDPRKTYYFTIFISFIFENGISSINNGILEGLNSVQHGKPDKLMISFHGIPQRFVDNGDIYYEHCVNTSHLMPVCN
jgi:ferrochelatase